MELNISVDTKDSAVVIEPRKGSFIYCIPFNNCYMIVEDYRAEGKDISFSMSYELDWVDEDEHNIMVDNR